MFAAPGARAIGQASVGVTVSGPGTISTDSAQSGTFNAIVYPFDSTDPNVPQGRVDWSTSAGDSGWSLLTPYGGGTNWAKVALNFTAPHTPQTLNFTAIYTHRDDQWNSGTGYGSTEVLSS